MPSSRFIRRFLVLVLVLASACAKKSGPSAICAESTCQAPPNGNTAQALLSYDIYEDVEPAKYAVKFILTNAKSTKYDLYRVVRQKKLELVAHFRGPDAEMAVEHQPAGEIFELELFEASSDGNEPVQMLKLTLPRDVVISTRVAATELDFSNISRLYMLEGAVITTNGRDLKIQASQLIAEKGALIETFPAGSIGLENRAGKSGGKVEIFAGHASGELTISLRGENAGKWTQEPPSHEKDEAYRGTKGAPGIPSVSAWIPFPNHAICLRPAGAGGPGGDGKMGPSGFTGLSGGESGELTVNIKEGRDFLITHHREPGQGGDGSVGGVGGLGGLGGDPGPNSANPSGVCPNGKPGPIGKIGPRGPKGGAGKSGQLGQVCLKLAETAGMSCM